MVKLGPIQRYANCRRNDNCVYMVRERYSYIAGLSKKSWADKSCSYNPFYDKYNMQLMCERGGWVADPRTGKEYMVLEMSASTLNHDTNQEKCRKIEGHLPEPRDEQDNLFLDSLGAERFVLGINDNKVEGQWVFESDGSPVNWLSWANFQGRESWPRKTNGNCVSMTCHNRHVARGAWAPPKTDSGPSKIVPGPLKFRVRPLLNWTRPPLKWNPSYVPAYII